ncbi:MAG: peptide chain release factor N(5)-glutamine methyltransferase [Alphaproteobacteria bacterium HGW-Alphaproteobacteria-3]|nr:MAG: peptide chain release factor N(5)-glutamine methyltransferase [Alphaproteobacteria bacterium HGW-Alphaproteobacteria-3]
MTTRDHAMRMLAHRLKEAGLSTPALDARILIQAATGASDLEMIREPGTLMTPVEEERLAAFERRRLAHEPVSRILGSREFWGLPFTVTAETLDPRADSETLVETALGLLKDIERPRILDLGTGTGCLLLALLHERQDAVGTGVDLSEGALAVAASNASALVLSARAEFIESEWTENVEGRFDLAISNPPYIPHGDIAGLAGEVRLHDPMLALDGGEDGLDAYRVLARLLPDHLTQPAHAVIELGAGQADAVAAIFEAAGFGVSRIVPDLGGVPRALVAAWPRA